MRNLSLLFKPLAVGFFRPDSLFDLHPGNVGRHSFGFKWTRTNTQPPPIVSNNENECAFHWIYTFDSLKMELIKTAGLAMSLNYGAHVSASWAYHQFCTPKSFWDIAQSLISTASPMCSFVLSTMQTTQHNYATVLTSSLLSAVVGILKVKAGG
jgi:hypothetical protein